MSDEVDQSQPQFSVPWSKLRLIDLVKDVILCRGGDPQYGIMTNWSSPITMLTLKHALCYTVANRTRTIARNPNFKVIRDDSQFNRRLPGRPTISLCHSPGGDVVQSVNSDTWARIEVHKIHDFTLSPTWEVLLVPGSHNRLFVAPGDLQNLQGSPRRYLTRFLHQICKGLDRFQLVWGKHGMTDTLIEIIIPPPISEETLSSYLGAFTTIDLYEFRSKMGTGCLIERIVVKSSEQLMDEGESCEACAQGCSAQAATEHRGGPSAGEEIGDGDEAS